MKAGRRADPARPSAVGARARALLRRCCSHAEGEACDGCDASVPLVLPRLEDPGSLARRGPLAPDVQRRIETIAGNPLRTGNAVKPLLEGADTYTAMLDLLERAREQVLFENFIFRDDAVGTAFAGELKARAGDGLAVRVLHDPFGSLMSRRAPIGLRFRGTAVDVRVYNPPRPTAAFLRAGRDHRKLVVGDGDQAVIGGLCLADAWLGNCIERCTWRDSAVWVEGEAVHDATRAFEETWRRGVSFTPGGERAGEAVSAPGKPGGASGAVPVRMIADGWGRRVVERVLRQVIGVARHEILITNPYLVPPPGLAEALQGAARRGVTVEIIVPLHNNHRIVALASEHAWGPLLEAGVRVWRWTGPMIHAKTVVVDRAWVLVGSSNLDRLSLHGNAELNVEIHGSAMGRSMAAVFARDRLLSRRLELSEWDGRSIHRKLLTRLAASGRRWM